MVRCVSMSGMYGRGRVAPAFASEFMGVSGSDTIFGYANTGYRPVREEESQQDVEKKREANRRKQRAYYQRQKAKRNK